MNSHTGENSNIKLIFRITCKLKLFVKIHPNTLITFICSDHSAACNNLNTVSYQCSKTSLTYIPIRKILREKYCVDIHISMLTKTSNPCFKLDDYLLVSSVAVAKASAHQHPQTSNFLDHVTETSFFTCRQSFWVLAQPMRDYAK